MTVSIAFDIRGPSKTFISLRSQRGISAPAPCSLEETSLAMRILLLSVLGSICVLGAGPDQVLVISNRSSAISRQIAAYYMHRRAIPASHLCEIDAPEQETIDRQTYEARVAGPVGRCLQERKLTETALYLVAAQGVPLRVEGSGSGMKTERASVDSELCLLYSDLKGVPHPLSGPLNNPFYRHKESPFRHPDFPIYLVTRLAGYDFADVKALIDHAIQARNLGRFVIDLNNSGDGEGNDWLRTAALLLPESRLVFDASTTVLYRQTDVIASASWGSNDENRHERNLGYKWLPGAILTEYVSTDGRTFQRPPGTWRLGKWEDKSTYFAGTPQSLIADYIHEGVTGASGHVYEPFLQFTPHPDQLLPAYYKGRNLAESFYLAIPGLSWQNIVVGDPLCSLGPPSGSGK